jgi:hypothetical protein
MGNPNMKSNDNSTNITDQLKVYRDIFAEITAKATPLEFDPKDPERIIAYRIPCGPLHRAAGKLGFQMFNGEAYLMAAQERIRELEGSPKRGPKEIDASGVDLSLSGEAKDEIREIERAGATAVHRARNFLMD